MLKKWIYILLASLLLLCSCENKNKTTVKSYADNVKETVNSDTFFIVYDGVGLTQQQYKNLMGGFDPIGIFSMPASTVNELKDETLHYEESKFESDGVIYDMGPDLVEWTETANKVTLSRNEYYKLIEIMNPDMIDVLDKSTLEILLNETNIKRNVSEKDMGNYTEKTTVITMSENKKLTILEYKYKDIPEDKGEVELKVLTNGGTLYSSGYQRWDNQYIRYLSGDENITTASDSVVLKTDISDKVETTLFCTLIVLEIN